jgi:hypothetical protein
MTTTGFVPPVNIAGTAARLPTMKGITMDRQTSFSPPAASVPIACFAWMAPSAYYRAAGNGPPGFSGDGGPAADAGEVPGTGEQAGHL